MLRTTQLHGYHAEHSKLTEFAGYEMPLWYTSTSEEHLAVRNHSGIFDISHMGRFEVSGPESTKFLENLVPTQVQQQPVGKAFYTLLLNERGGIIDDLIIMRLGDAKYMVVVNAANADTDMRHMKAEAPSSGLEISDSTSSSAMIAVQGPEAQSSLQRITDLDLSTLKRFRSAETKVLGQTCLVSRTGYTGEDGFEAIVMETTNDDPSRALGIWGRLAEISTPCGLGARDSLRLEAGFPLHGSDIDANTNPFQADLSWVITPGKSGYVGSGAIAEAKDAPPDIIRRGLILDQGIPRHGFEVDSPSGRVGEVTSGTFSPILRKGIALCKVDRSASEFGDQVTVQVRETKTSARVIKPPFYDEKLYGWRRVSNGN